MRPPLFWNVTDGREAAPTLRALLGPLAWVQTALTRRRLRRGARVDVGVPVVCVGNATMGGTGKTPVVMYLVESLQRMGIAAVALSRGHGGSLRGPVRVGADVSALDVGDEALLLGAVGPAYVARDRSAGAEMAVAQGARTIVMDDGHQNASLAKALNLLVVDAEVGFGNGRVFPAGPLREPAAEAIARADAIILMQPHAEYDPAPELVSQFGDAKVIPAWLAPRERVPGGPLLAFAGIGRPDKFFDTVRRSGGTVVEEAAFADHHVFRPEELRTLAVMAREHGATLITTDKDYVRLPVQFRRRVARLPVGVEFGDELALRQLLHPIIRKARA